MGQAMPEGLVRGADDLVRCSWGATTPDYQRYHDREWGRPVTQDRRLFEKICLEGFQAGLSWLTILRKRPAFRRAFDNFDFRKVARYDRRRVERLLRDAGIVRHRGKIESVVNNARRALELSSEVGSLAAFFWAFEPGASERPRLVTRAAVMAIPTTPGSTRLSRELKRRGWTFVGPTTVYAFMQAMGLVNDHFEGCHAREVVERARAALQRPARRVP
jgi:DNA-3-methyladenine glycosylase I